MNTIIKLNTLQEAMEFVNTASKVHGNVLLTNPNRICVSGKSVLGVFTASMNSPMVAEYPDDIPDEFRTLLRKLQVKESHNNG